MSQSQEEDIVTISELVEHDARNLAGCDNDDTCCTFTKGYVYRQALYVCITCQDISKKTAGICYPCSVHCHDGHELIDLFTKRNFRCDCGNGSFPESFKCNLWEDKDDVNVKNSYNHNFSGLFCACKSKYKDIQESEDMYQCNICEDWYHLTHLSSDEEQLSIFKRILTDDSKEFTCKICTKKHEFLSFYNTALVSENIFQFPKKESNLCIFTKIKSMLKGWLMHENSQSCGLFWPENWRESLCSCSSCKKMMEENGLQFLLSEKDLMSYYYAQMTDDGDSNYDIKEVLSELPHTQAIRVAEGIASYKRELTKFINSHDPSKVITSDDVKDFFDNLKKRRLDGSGFD